MRLDVRSLRDAVEQLQAGLDHLGSELAAGDAGIRAQFRTAVVQEFEYVYELGTKLLRRWLELRAIDPQEVRAAGFMDLMRRAADAGAPVDVDRWFGYRELRNRTSHTYDQEQASLVVAEVPGFLSDAQRLLAFLEDA